MSFLFGKMGYVRSLQGRFVDQLLFNWFRLFAWKWKLNWWVSRRYSNYWTDAFFYRVGKGGGFQGEGVP